MPAWTSEKTSEKPPGTKPGKTPRKPRRKRAIRAAKLGVALLGSLPAARIGWLLAEGQLGANPVAEALNRLGFWALTLLLASLAPTPIKILTGWTWPIALRKMLGLLAFGYACLHFAVYVGVDQFFDFGEIVADIVKRKFITVGFAALVLLVPLAATSTSGMVKRLGARRWNKLHRLVYLAAALGVVHFVWRVKADLFQPLVMAAVLTALMAVRLGSWLGGRGKIKGGEGKSDVRQGARPAAV
jgi:methionine sulfoxide reductase heme-binding subunit